MRNRVRAGAVRVALGTVALSLTCYKYPLAPSTGDSWVLLGSLSAATCQGLALIWKVALTCTSA